MGFSNAPSGRLAKQGGNRCNFIGDSITNRFFTTGSSHLNTIKTNTGLTVVNNEGVDGNNFARFNESASSQKISTRYASVSANVDLHLVWGGINDTSYWTSSTTNPTGTENIQDIIGSITDTTDVTVYGSCYVVYYGLKAMSPNAIIAFITPSYADKHTTGSKQVDPVAISQIAAAIKAWCRANGVPCLDAYNCGAITSGNLGSTTSDNLHPNATGYSNYITPISNFISSLLN